MTYDPDNAAHRQELAESVTCLVTDLGFTREYPQRGRYETKEAVYSKETDDHGIRVVVYTSAVDGAVRGNGRDAIRVIALYRNREGYDKGIAKAQKRVNRTGTITTICQRVVDRISEVWTLARTGERCSYCGAPKFKSKKGNMVCADICWRKRQQGWGA